MTLPNEEVLDLLRDNFIVASRNIERDRHVGVSHGYRTNQTAVGTTNGAGGRNVQLIVLACDETVLHVLPGFWNPRDLVTELLLALEVNRLHQDEERTAAEKAKLFATLHRSHLARHEASMLERSAWQDFDQHHEVMRAQTEKRDTFVVQGDGSQMLKTIPQVVHDRMVARPFKKLADFGMESFVDYGRPYYDNNRGVDQGRNFPRAVQENEKRARELAKQREEAETLKRKLEKAAKARAKTSG